LNDHLPIEQRLFKKLEEIGEGDFSLTLYKKDGLCWVKRWELPLTNKIIEDLKSTYCDCGDTPNGPLRKAADCPRCRGGDSQFICPHGKDIRHIDCARCAKPYGRDAAGSCPKCGHRSI